MFSVDRLVCELPQVATRSTGDMMELSPSIPQHQGSAHSLHEGSGSFRLVGCGAPGPAHRSHVVRVAGLINQV